MSGIHDNFTQKFVHILIEKTLTKIIFRNNENYIIYSDNIGTRKAEYIITRHIESDTGSTVSSSSEETYVIPAKCWRTLLPGRNVSPRHRQQADFLGQYLDQLNSYYKTLKTDIFFVRCFIDGSYMELLLKEVKTIHSISGCDLQQMVNGMLPTLAKHGNVLA